MTIVPEGLVLLTALTYAVATTRMTRRGALSQQLNAVESLASADTICMDKTGTLTEERLRVVELTPADEADEGELSVLLGRYAASSPSRNSTLEAIAAAYPGAPEPVRESVPFSSRRRWSGVAMGGRAYVLGAPEHFDLSGRLEARARQEAEAGRRVLAFAVGDARLAAPGPDSPPPAGLRVLALIALAEELRPDARETVAFLLEQGVDIKVISGDNPATVAAIAADAGIPVRGEPVDGRELPPDESRMRELAREATVVGRISPEGKRRFVESLAAQGRYVAMVGDGVNDVPALKAARLAIAQGSGSQMARAIADVVLVKGGFASIPAMIAEGRKLLRNLQRVAKLFVAKSALAAFLILTVGISSESYPFLPRHLTLASAITIGIPAFFLALAPSTGPWRPVHFLRDLASFAIPAGTAAGLGVVAELPALDQPHRDERAARPHGRDDGAGGDGALPHHRSRVVEPGARLHRRRPLRRPLRPLPGGAVPAGLARLLPAGRARPGDHHRVAGGDGSCGDGSGADRRTLPSRPAPARNARTAVRISASVMRIALVTHHAQTASISTSSA